MSQAAASPRSEAVRTARAEAAVWIVRLNGDKRGPEMEAGLRAWLAADPENARQFEHITELWEMGGAVSAAGLPRLRSWHGSTSRIRWVSLATAAIICMFAVLATWWWMGAVYATAHGEQRLVHLDDGSRVYLNSNSRLRVQFGRHERRVQLDRGEGMFEVAKDPSRLFIVQAGNRQVTALGTTFVVRYEHAGMAVTLVEGKVTVAPISAPSVPANSVPANHDTEHQSASVHGSENPVFTLTPGKRLTLARQSEPKIDAPRIEAVTAWRRGEVLLEATPLVEAIEEMNRYDKRQLVIDDAQLAKMRVSGIYRTGNSLGFAQALAELHSLQIVETATEIRLQPQTSEIPSF